MTVIRRILGVLVMVAGFLGLVLSLAGLVLLWTIRPEIAGYLKNTFQTLESSVKTSQMAMEVTARALGATVDSVDALSSMLSTTAASVENTKPVIGQVKTMMGETLPSSLDSAVLSLRTAQQAADVLDSAIKSIENFQIILSATPLLSALVEQPKQAYRPEVPLSESLGELATNLEDLPAMFTEMSANLSKADGNLDSIQENLTTMSASVTLISSGLSEYQRMVYQSKSSLDNLLTILTQIENNLPKFINGATIIFGLLFFWLLSAQVVILSQGWELYHGTTGRMEGKSLKSASGEAAVNE